MAESVVKVNRDTLGVTVVSLNRPEKCNALNTDMLNQLIEELKRTHKLQDQRVIIIRGEGKVFCSGLDLEETLKSKNAEHTATLIATLLKSIYCSPLVTIAAIHGAAFAGGGGIAAACDYTLASEHTRIGFPEVRRGLVAALVSTLLRRQLSERSIRELLLIGEPVDAKRALHMGLINSIVAEEDLLGESMRLAEEVKRGAPAAIVETKRLLEDLQPTTLVEDMDKAMIFHKQSRMHNEAKEGMKAFLEDREPNWIKQ